MTVRQERPLPHALRAAFWRAWLKRFAVWAVLAVIPLAILLVLRQHEQARLQSQQQADQRQVALDKSVALLKHRLDPVIALTSALLRPAEGSATGMGAQAGVRDRMAFRMQLAMQLQPALSRLLWQADGQGAALEMGWRNGRPMVLPGAWPEQKLAELRAVAAGLPAYRVYSGPVHGLHVNGRLIEPAIWLVDVVAADKSPQGVAKAMVAAQIDVSPIIQSAVEALPPDLPITYVSHDGTLLHADHAGWVVGAKLSKLSPELWQAMQKAETGQWAGDGAQMNWARVSMRSITQSAAQAQHVYALTQSAPVASGLASFTAEERQEMWRHGLGLWALLASLGGLVIGLWMRRDRRLLSQVDQLQQVFDAQATAVLVLQADGTPLYCNAAGQSLLGQGLAAVIAARCPLVLSSREAKQTLDWFGVDGRAHQDVLHQAHLFWGDVPALLWTLHAVPSLPQGKPNEERLQAAMDDLFMRATYRPDQTIADVNELYCRINGRSREELLGQSLRDVRRHEVFSSSELERLWPDLRAGRTVARRFKRVDAAGNAWHVRAMYVPLMDQQGELESVQFWGTDITELENLRLELGNAEARFRAYLDTSLEAIVVHDRQGVLVEINQAGCDLMGRNKAELLGRNMRDFMPEVDPQRLLSRWQRAKDGEVYPFSTLVQAGPGRVLPLEGRIRCVWVMGEPYFVAVGHDVSNERRMSQDLHSQQQAIQASMQVLELDPQGHFIRANALWLEQFGPDPEAMEGRVLLHHCPVGLLEESGTNRLARDEMSLRNRHGQTVYLDTTAYRALDVHGDHARTVILSVDVTNQAELRNRLQASESRLRAFMQTSDDGYWLLDEQSRILDANQALCDLLGYTHHELVGMSAADVDKGMRLGEVRAHLRASDQGIVSRRFESSLRTAKGQLIPVDARLTAQSQGGVVLFMGMMRDLRAQRSQQRHMVQLSDAINRSYLVLELDVRGYFQSANDAFLKRFGRLATEYKNRPVRGFALEDLRTRVQQAGDGKRGLAVSAATWQAEHLSLTGESIWLRSTVYAVQDDVGGLASYVIFSEDISASVRARQELERAQQLTETYMAFPPIGLFVHDRYGNFTEANRAFCDMLGMRREEILSLSILDVEAALPVEQLAERWHTMDLQDAPHSYQGRGRRSDGTEIDWTVTLRLVDVADERVFLGSAQDLTLEKSTQRVLERQRQALDRSHLSLTLTVDGRVMDANNKLLERMGFELSDMLGRTQQELGMLAGDDAQAVEQDADILSRVRGGEPVQREVRWTTRQGEHVWLLATYYPVLDATDQCESVTVLALDVSDQKAGEVRLRESQKLEAIGQLTGGLAHDFNNLLGIVVGNLDLVEEGLPAEDESLHESFYAARDAAIRGASVAHALLSVARRQKMDLALTDVNQLLSDLMGLLASSAGTRVRLRSQLCAGPLWAMLDASGLSNVVLNLVINARDALVNHEGSHEIALRTKRVHVSLAQTGQLQPGDYALISVQDNGPGMAPEVLSRAFDPFFTTKEQGKGTGLGLAMVRGYAEQLGGLARIESQPGAGATVLVYLPLSIRQAHEQAQDETQRLQALHGLKLLDAPARSELDALVQEAAAICQVPTALISLVDTDRQWFAAKVGLDVQQTPRDVAFCDHAISAGMPVFEVPDARVAPAFSANALVTQEPHIRFYAGVPLQDAQGHGLGTLCVLDYEPRKLDATQRRALMALAERARGLLLADADAQADTQADTQAEIVPPAPDPAAPVAVAKPVEPKRAGVAHVLVVDDEQGLCRIACKWLKQLGVEATGCLSAAEALIALQAQTFDLVFSDVLMPGDLDGMALARQVLRDYPGLPVVLTTGFAPSVHDRQEMPAPVLNKPYRKDDLARMLQQLRLLPDAAQGGT
jgi:PAS domain S-box-containing protein